MEGLEKFLALEEEKRERIITAAMKEFLAGYKHASTDNIVREAGISKGLLFYYFGTKERLYLYLVEHLVKIFQEEFLDLLNVHQPDILDSVWQMSLLKRDLSAKYPVIFDFMTSAYLDPDVKDGAAKELLSKALERRIKIMTEVYNCADYSLFRDDIDPEKAVMLINWALQGYAESTAADASLKMPSGTIRENYDQYLQEFKAYLDILRKCFYKEDKSCTA